MRDFDWMQWSPEDERFLHGTDEDRQAIRDRRWAKQVPARFIDADLARLDPAVSAAVRQWMSGTMPLPNLVFVGPVGVGKTQAALAAAREFHYSDAIWTFQPVVELLAALRPGIDERVGEDVERQFKNAAVVVLDDVGGERTTDWAVEQLYRLVNRRWLDNLPIIATTNIPTKKLAAATGERIVSRLMGGATVIELTGKDRRY